MDLDTLRAGIVRVPCALERLRQSDVRQFVSEIDFDPLDPAQVPKLAGGILFAIDADDDNAVAGGQLRGGACDIQFVEAGADPHRLRLLRGDRVPFDARGRRRDRLEGLRILVWVGDALRTGADAGRDAGRELVSDQPRQHQHRTALRRRAEIGFVGNSLLVEGQHVCEHGKRIAQRNRVIVRSPRRQRRKRRIVGARQAGQQRLLEIRVRSDPVRDCRQSGAIELCRRRVDLDAGAATAIGDVVHAHGLFAPVHFEPEHAVLGIVQAVLEPRDLQPTDR